jgi:8-oxo-dGTP diphosphatase
MEYVAGFLFNETEEKVALIEKQKPAWQKGKLNGIGGKIEPDETPAEAMRREFTEETGVEINSWQHYVTLTGSGFTVHFFHSTESDDVLAQLRSTTDEEVKICWVENVSVMPTIPNLPWLIPMALSMKNERADHFLVMENAA